jgi:ketosteroid isomerase-like protein
VTSEENVLAVRRLAAAVNEGPIPRELLADDFELKNATTAVTDATYRGYEGGLKWRDDLFDVVDDARYEIDEILAAGPDYVVVANHVAGRGSSSGVPVELRWASVFWLRKGQIARVAGFERRRDALRAVGLAD